MFAPTTISRIPVKAAVFYVHGNALNEGEEAFDASIVATQRCLVVVILEEKKVKRKRLETAVQQGASE